LSIRAHFGRPVATEIQNAHVISESQTVEENISPVTLS